MNKGRRGVSGGFCKGLMCELCLEVQATLAGVVGREGGGGSREKGQHRDREGDTFDTERQPSVLGCHFWGPIRSDLELTWSCVRIQKAADRL